MTTKVSQPVPIECMPGVQPSTDKTAFATKHWVMSDKIRFVNGKPQKIGGWTLITFTGATAAVGVMRSIYSAILGGLVKTILGTHQKLYSLIGSTLTNITPLLTSTTAIADSLATHYGTLGNDPVSVTINSTIVTITDADYARYQVGDTYTLASATTTGGVTDTVLNAAHVIRALPTGTVQFWVSLAASSTATGGGASVVRTDGLIRVTAASHGQLDGDRVKIAAAATSAGITDVQINLEFIIRNVAAGTFDVMTAGTATSSASAQGGASTTYQKEIADGVAYYSFGQGYGMGKYGVGKYGVSKISTSGLVSPRIWFSDRFGELIITTPGNQKGVYKWDGLVAAAPILVPNAPTAVNYAFVSDRILVTLGAAGVPNKIFASDQDDITVWTASSVNQVFEQNVEGAGRLLSHVPVAGLNLIFTENSTHTLRYLGNFPWWEIKLKDPTIGIIAPMARVAVNDIAYWMADNNFYMWRGGNVEIMPANSQSESTILRYVFDNINRSQKGLCFAWYNDDFNEIWFHYPSAGSENPDRVARVNKSTYEWTPDTFDRLAAEYPNVLTTNPRLAALSGSNSTVYRHETTSDADGAAMEWSITTNKRTAGKDTINNMAVIPDSTQVGDINLHIDSYLFPQSTTKVFNQDYTVEVDSERIPMTVNGRYWQYTLSGEAVGQTFRMGGWQEDIQKGAAN